MADSAMRDRQLGTPSEDVWEGCTALPDWNTAFPIWFKTPFHPTVRDRVDAAGLDLLEQFVAYDPKDRITAKDALNHPYFDDLDKENV